MSDDLASPRAQHYRILPDYERTQIIAKRIHGLSVKRISQQHNIDPATVWRICKPMQESTKQVADDWKREQVELAKESVNRALVDDSDTYRSATIGLKVLEGLGEYAQNVEFSGNIVVAWANEASRDVIDITPEQRQLVDNKE